MKVETRQSKIHGTGVFAKEQIPLGEVVLQIDDSWVIDDSPPVRERLDKDSDHYDYLPDGTTILMQEPERYINHSCDPNLFVYSVDKTRFLLAMCDIAKGEEIIYDYSINAVDGDIWDCRCGSTNCRGRHKCDFFDLSTDKQLQYLPFLDPWFAEVHKDRILALLLTAQNR